MVPDFLSVCVSCVFALLFFFFKILVCLFSLSFLKRKRRHELGGRVGSGKSWRKGNHDQNILLKYIKKYFQLEKGDHGECFSGTPPR